MDDLKPLLVFAAVLEHGSMNAAAQALAMTPSAVSQHIARLENLHGVKLLHRSTRRVSPTDAGAALGQYCRRLNATLHDTRLALANLKTEIAGEVRLAAPTSMANAAAFQRALRRIGDEHPALRLQLHFGEALADLRSGAIDIALRAAIMRWTRPTSSRAISPTGVGRFAPRPPGWNRPHPFTALPTCCAIAGCTTCRYIWKCSAARHAICWILKTVFIATSSRRCACCARRDWGWR